MEMSFIETSDDMEKFIDAAQNGRLKEVIELLSKFINFVGVVSLALHEGGHLDVVKWLVKHTAADVNNWRVFTPLTAACSKDHLDTVKYLVEICHADVNLSDSDDDTPLIEACRCVSISITMYLLCKVSDLDVNFVDRYGNTALHYVVWCSKDDNAMLHWACIRGDVTEVLRLVFLGGHKINAQDPTGNTPLHLACYNGHSDIVETLMLAGADETITNDLGETPARMAGSGWHSELLKLLDIELLLYY